MIPNELLYALGGLGLTLLAAKIGLPLKGKLTPQPDNLRELVRQILWEILQPPQPTQPPQPPLQSQISNEQLRQKLMEWKQ